MKCIALLTLLALIVGPALAADPEAGLAAIQELGRVNGQALACSQMAVSSQAKKLMIQHSPKTRRYGEVFEEATNAAYLEQGKEQDRCPKPMDFSARLSELSERLQATLPAAQ
jgi:hypothetical protein